MQLSRLELKSQSSLIDSHEWIGFAKYSKDDDDDVLLELIAEDTELVDLTRRWQSRFEES